MIRSIAIGAALVAGAQAFSVVPAGMAPAHAATASSTSLRMSSAPVQGNTRRDAIGTLLAGGAGLVLPLRGGNDGPVPAASAEGGPYSLPPHPVGENARAPHIVEMTMKIHHDKHHQANVNNVNKALEGGQVMELVDLQKGAMASAAIRNNGGGHYNHAMFWTTLAPAAKSGAPSPALAKAIDESFGSMDKMKEAFSAAAAKRFGSGWAWMGVSPDGKIVIDSTPNQDNPLMDGVNCQKMIPILGLDVWEHAYYLKYMNKRPDYIKAFFSVINWSQVSEYYEQYASKGKAVPIQG